MPVVFKSSPVAYRLIAAMRSCNSSCVCGQLPSGIAAEKAQLIAANIAFYLEKLELSDTAHSRLSPTIRRSGRAERNI